MDELLKSLETRSAGRWGIGTAEWYISSIAPCLNNEDLCPANLFGDKGAEAWAKELEAAKSRFTYCDDGMITKELKTSDLSDSKYLAEIEAVLTTTTRDRDGDVLECKGAEIDDRMPLLWQHMMVQPLGPFLGVTTRDDDQIVGKSAILATKFGEDVVVLVEGGALRISHGFKPTKYKPLEVAKGAGPNGEDIILGWHVTNYRMLEKSVVSVPSNKDAIITAFSRSKLHSPLVKSWAETMYRERPVISAGTEVFATLKEGPPVVTADEVKTIVADAVTGIVDQAVSAAVQAVAEKDKKTVPYRGGDVKKGTWDAASAKKRVEKWATGGGKLAPAKYRQAFAWYDEEKQDNLGAYKLPHHDIVGDSLVVHRQGVISAMGAIQGARGGVDIPDSDRRSVYNHLASHYRKDLDMDPPDFKDTLDVVVKSADGVMTKMLGMDSHYLEGSWEWIEHRLWKTSRAFLIGKEVDDIDEYSSVYIVGTFEDSAIVCVDPWSDKQRRCFQMDWGVSGDGMPSWTGDPVEVEIKAQVIAKAMDDRYCVGVVKKGILELAEVDGADESIAEIKATLNLLEPDKEHLLFSEFIDS